MNIGDKVTIKECHSIPEIVGRQATIVAMFDPELSEDPAEKKYPIRVKLIGDPIEVPIPMITPQGLAMGKGETHGPLPFREEELEPADPNAGIPDEVLKAFEGDEPEQPV